MSRRLFAAALLAVVLEVLQVVLGEAFPVAIAAALILSPLVSWRAFRRLRVKHKRWPWIQSLRTAMFTALFLALISAELAGIGLFVVARALELVEPLTREQFLVLLAWPLLLLTGPAVEWIQYRPSTSDQWGDQ